jgi:hypothetical protein
VKDAVAARPLRTIVATNAANVRPPYRFRTGDPYGRAACWTHKKRERASVFEKAIRLVEEYHGRHAGPQDVGADDQLVQEIHRRLRQLEHLYRDILSLQGAVLQEQEAARGRQLANTNWVLVFTHFGAPPGPGPVPDGFATLSTQERLLLNTEAFYYFAHRVKVIIEQCRTHLPGITPLRARAVTRVRNNLLEHANKKSGTTVFSYSVSKAAGIRLRPVSRTGETRTYVDQGIVRNAKELAAELQKTFEERRSGPRV